MKLTKRQRESIRNMFGGRCSYCGIELPEKGWQVDHLEPVLRKTEYRHSDYVNGQYIPAKIVATGEVYMPHREREDNLMPCCRACNIDKSALNLETWRQRIADLVGCLRRNYPTYRHAERFGLVVAEEKPIVFWFERYTGKNSERLA